ncbi:MAG: hypothetical protein DSZ23_00580 [Thermodesulfatator sp.]|nr:MAG: hypothetical protein DSZ23_00580 [Thermodesulfatator sp.]
MIRDLEKSKKDLAVIIFQSEISGKTVGRFVGIDRLSLTEIVLKTDHAMSKLPAETTIHIYDFIEKKWEMVQGFIVSCKQSENPGNFILHVNLHPFDTMQEMVLEDSRILQIMGKMEFFMSLKFFELLPSNTIWAVLSRITSVSYHEGDKIMTQGVRGDGIYFIEQGGCYIIVDRDDDYILQATRRKGDMVGVMALLTDEPRPANVVAATDVHLWRLARNCFTLLVEEQQELRKFFITLVCERLESDGLLADLAIGKYMIDHKIGQGAWAIVYRGHHMSLGRDVAIKLLHHQMALEEDFRKRFLEEAKIIARMQHRNIINIYDVENRFNMLFIIMEYLEGLPLDVILKKKGRFSAAEVTDVLFQACRGLAYAHARGIVHQDIKPDNLFMLTNGTIKILDFGLACPFGAENMEMEGTLQYMSPEQIESYPVDGRTDLYGLGITAFQLLTGRLPHPDDDPAKLMDLHLHTDIPDPREFVKETPPALAEFIMTCCRRNPDEHFPDVNTALNSLKKLAHEKRKLIPWYCCFSQYGFPVLIS